VRTKETEADSAKLKSMQLEQNLFEIKDRIMEVTRKLDKGKQPQLDLDKQSGDKKAWGGESEVDALCSIFVNYLTQIKEINESSSVLDTGRITQAAEE